MKIPFTSTQLVGHRIGQPLTKTNADEGQASVRDNKLLRMLPFKLRPVRQTVMEGRLRAQIVSGIGSPPHAAAGSQPNMAQPTAAQGQAAAQMRPSPLAKLPAELIEKIYKEVTADPSSTNTAALAQTSKHLREIILQTAHSKLWARKRLRQLIGSEASENDAMETLVRTVLDELAQSKASVPTYVNQSDPVDISINKAEVAAVTAAVIRLFNNDATLFGDSIRHAEDLNALLDSLNNILRELPNGEDKEDACFNLAAFLKSTTHNMNLVHSEHLSILTHLAQITGTLADSVPKAKVFSELAANVWERIADWDDSAIAGRFNAVVDIASDLPDVQEKVTGLCTLAHCIAHVLEGSPSSSSPAFQRLIEIAQKMKLDDPKAVVTRRLIMNLDAVEDVEERMQCFDGVKNLIVSMGQSSGKDNCIADLEDAIPTLFESPADVNMAYISIRQLRQASS